MDGVEELVFVMQMIPFQINPGEDGTRDTVPGATDGAGKYGEGLGGEEVAGKYGG